MRVQFVYASETGTAQDVAECLWRDCRQREIPARVCGLDEIDIDKLPEERLVVFVIATSGQGEMPTNMRAAWKRLLRRSLGAEWLASTSFAVAALGDSSYQKYNFAGKKFYRRILQLGGRPLLRLALCDDQHELGIDGELTAWRTELFSTLQSMFPDCLPADAKRVLPAKYELKWVDVAPTDPMPSDFVPVLVISNTRATAEDHFQDTRMISFDVGKFANELRYNPGDVLMVHPHNPQETIDVAVKALGYSDDLLDRSFRLKPTDADVRLPPSWLVGEVTTLRQCFSRVFDLQHVPRKTFFEVLGAISADEMESERLLELASPERLDELLDYTVRARRTAAETLRDFYRTAAQIQPERLFDVFPVIRARAFSIASCPLTHTGRIELLVAKVEYKARMADARRGLCSTFISRLKHGDKVWVRIRPGTFRFPENSLPVVTIGPGTGVAPFRSLLNYRVRCDSQPASSVLFFGCRGRRKDFYFSDEWPLLPHTRVLTAFSRDQADKIYVQDVIANNAALVWEHISDGGFIFIAGSAGDMPKAVCAALNGIGEAHGFSELVADLEKRGRIQYETWD